MQRASGLRIREQEPGRAVPVAIVSVACGRQSPPKNGRKHSEDSRREGRASSGIGRAAARLFAADGGGRSEGRSGHVADRHPGHRLPGARLARAARGPSRNNDDVHRDRQGHPSVPLPPSARSRALARRTASPCHPLPSRGCAPTARSRAIDGAWSASESSYAGRTSAATPPLAEPKRRGFSWSTRMAAASASTPHRRALRCRQRRGAYRRASSPSGRRGDREGEFESVPHDRVPFRDRLPVLGKDPRHVDGRVGDGSGCGLEGSRDGEALEARECGRESKFWPNGERSAMPAPRCTQFVDTAMFVAAKVPHGAPTTVPPFDAIESSVFSRSTCSLPPPAAATLSSPDRRARRTRRRPATRQRTRPASSPRQWSLPRSTRTAHRRSSWHPVRSSFVAERRPPSAQRVPTSKRSGRGTVFRARRSMRAVVTQVSDSGKNGVIVVLRQKIGDVEVVERDATPGRAPVARGDRGCAAPDRVRELEARSVRPPAGGGRGGVRSTRSTRRPPRRPHVASCPPAPARMATTRSCSPTRPPRTASASFGPYTRRRSTSLPASGSFRPTPSSSSRRRRARTAMGYALMVAADDGRILRRRSLATAASRSHGPQTAGPTVALAAATAAPPTFTAPAVIASTTLTFELSVRDGLASATDTVDVVVEPGGTGGEGGDAPRDGPRDDADAGGVAPEASGAPPAGEGGCRTCGRATSGRSRLLRFRSFTAGLLLRRDLGHRHRIAGAVPASGRFAESFHVESAVPSLPHTRLLEEPCFAEDLPVMRQQRDADPQPLRELGAALRPVAGEGIDELDPARVGERLENAGAVARAELPS